MSQRYDNKIKSFYLKLYSTKNKELFRKIGDYMQYFGIFAIILCSLYYKDIDLFIKFMAYYGVCVSIAWVLKGLFNNK